MRPLMPQNMDWTTAQLPKPSTRQSTLRVIISWDSVTHSCASHPPFRAWSFQLRELPTDHLLSLELRMVFKLHSKQRFNSNFRWSICSACTWSTERPISLHARSTWSRLWMMRPPDTTPTHSSLRRTLSTLGWGRTWLWRCLRSALRTSDSSRFQVWTCQLNLKTQFKKLQSKTTRLTLHWQKRTT